VSNNRLDSSNHEQDQLKFINDYVKKRIVSIDGIDYKQSDNLRKIITDTGERVRLIS